MTDEPVRPTAAFYVADIMQARALARVAKSAGPEILALFTPRVAEFLGWRHLASLIKTLKEESDGHVNAQLDHALDLTTVRQGLQAGAAGVMIDAANLSYEENVALTSKVVGICHHEGVWTEGQIGLIPGTLYPVREDNPDDVRLLQDAIDSTPGRQKILEFAERTKVDYLAIPAGNSHTFRPDGDPSELNYRLIAAASRSVAASITIHGADTLIDEVLRSAILAGARKFNFGPVLKHAYLASLRESLSHPILESEFREIFEHAGSTYERCVAVKVAALSPYSSGRS